MYHGSMESGGQGIYLAHITRELARLGHEVHVISAPPYPLLDDAVHHHPIATHSFQSMLLDRAPYFGRRRPLSHFEPLNFFEFVSTRFTFSSLINVFSLRAIGALNEIEEEHGRFDMVHDNQCLGYGVLLMRALCGRAVVANVHHPLDVDLANGLAHVAGPAAKAQRILWYPWIMQRVVARRLDAVISGSHASAELVTRLWKLRPGLMRAIHDGVDTERFVPGESSERGRGELLFVGNAEDYNKGIVYLLRAMALLPRDCRAHLNVVGGPQAASKVVAREVGRLGIADRVTYIGRVSSDELAAWYRRARLLVAPSLYEGFGLPAVEAMASGTPVIATDAGALPELVVDGETGRVVPKGNPAALRDAIGDLLASPDACRRMGAAARARVVEHFTWQECGRKTEALYEEIVTTRRAHPTEG